MEAKKNNEDVLKHIPIALIIKNRTENRISKLCLEQS